MKIELNIQNLKCSGCANTIITKLSALENIDNVLVNPENSNVSFNYNNIEALENAKNKLKVLGYPINGEKNTLPSKAKSYISCAIGKIG